MEQIDKAKILFARLESQSTNVAEVAKRNFEIHSRLAQKD